MRTKLLLITPDSASAQTRQKWLAVYSQVGSISMAARRCGIARSTLQRWIKQKELEGLEDRSRRAHHLPRQQFDDEVENLVLQIRQTQNIGKIRICSFYFNSTPSKYR